MRALELKSSSPQVVRLVPISVDELRMSGATSGSERKESRTRTDRGPVMSVP